MAAPPHCRSLRRRGTPAGLPLSQRPPPPVQPKLAMTGPAELVTCDQTIEHTVRFAKQTLGWTTPRPRHPEQADRWTWLVLAGYTQLRLARQVACDQRLAWERPRPPGRLSPYRVRRGFPRLLCALGSPAAAPKPAGRSSGRPRAAAVGPPCGIRPSRSPPRRPVRRRPRPPRPPDWQRSARPAADPVSGQPGIHGLNHKLSLDPPCRNCRGLDSS
jgi:hypothetical protein